MLLITALASFLCACTPQQRTLEGGYLSAQPSFYQNRLTKPTAQNQPYIEGNASWYGPKFAGKPTSNGELFNPEALTAAHPDLPFNTLVKVTNIKNGKTVIVRINDRGPFVKGRIIDLSQAAARSIDMTTDGVVRVRLEIL